MKNKRLANITPGEILEEDFLMSPVGSKPARQGRIKTSQSEVSCL